MAVSRAAVAAKAAHRAQRAADAQAAGPAAAPAVDGAADDAGLAAVRAQLQVLRASGDNPTKEEFVRSHMVLDVVLARLRGAVAAARRSPAPRSERSAAWVTPTNEHNLHDLMSEEQQLIVVPDHVWCAVYLPVTYKGGTERYLLALRAPAPAALSPEQQVMMASARKGLIKLFADKLKRQNRSSRKLARDWARFAMAGMRAAPRNPHEFCVLGRGPTEQTAGQLYDTAADAVWEYICSVLGYGVREEWLQVQQRVWVDVCAAAADGVLPPLPSVVGAPMPPSRVFPFPGFTGVPFTTMSSVLECRTYLHCDRSDAPYGCFFCWNDNIDGDEA